MNTKMKVLYLVNIPSPYRVSFFNELGQLCDLTVLFERKASSARELSWHDYNFNNFQARFLNGINYGANSTLSFEVIKYLSDKKFDVVVVGGYSTPTGAVAITYLNLKKIPFVLNVDGGFADKDESKIKYRIKKYFISSANAWLSTGSVASSYLEYYGANSDAIYIYPFTALSESDLLTDVVDDITKKKLRVQLNIHEQCVALAVGRFVHGKGFDVLMRACANIPSCCGVYIIGGEPTREYLELKDELKLKNVHFVGFKSKIELAKYYKASDFFVMPTRQDVWGLVVNEAMANGLPVITTDKCVAGLELVKDYENGFVIPVNDEGLLAKRMNELIDNKELVVKMATSGLQKISSYTIEQMAGRTMQIFEKITGKDASRVR